MNIIKSICFISIAVMIITTQLHCAAPKSNPNFSSAFNSALPEQWPGSIGKEEKLKAELAKFEKEVQEKKAAFDKAKHKEEQELFAAQAALAKYREDNENALEKIKFEKFLKTPYHRIPSETALNVDIRKLSGKTTSISLFPSDDIATLAVKFYEKEGVLPTMGEYRVTGTGKKLLCGRELQMNQRRSIT